MSPPPQITLTLFFAQQNDRAVILRRGPHRLARLIAWKRSNDTFQNGQWLKARVYQDLCDLSPDGAHFLYCARAWSGRPRREMFYTAISRPPFFTALVFYPLTFEWGGGRFVDNRHYAVDAHSDDKFQHKQFSRVFDTGEARGTYANGNPVPVDRARRDSKQAQSRTRPESLGYETDGPCLFRIKSGRRVLIHDFSDMAFEEIVAPYGNRQNQRGWHPLERD